MGSFHGRRKPSSKKPAKAKGDSPEDIAARQAKEQFIKDMAAKAALTLPSSDAETGGIHPSRLARTAPGMAGGAFQNQFSGRQGSARGQRAPDLRQNNKRTFDDANGGSAGAAPSKKQRTLEEIRKLKGPAAMQKEQEKRRKKALKEEEEAKARKAEQLKKESGPQSDDEDAQIPSRTGKKSITDEKDSSKTAEEKAARKAAKAARKAARKAGSSETATEEESKEARKARRKAEKVAKKAQSSEPKETVSEPVKETKEERKERKKLAKLAKEEVKEKAKDKESSDAVQATPAASMTTNWSVAASSLGSKSSKFMKLMGGAKSGASSALSGHDETIHDKAKAARRAEAELERQYAAGQQAKQSGRKRGGLGA